MYLLRWVLAVGPLLLPKGLPLSSASMSLSRMDLGSAVKDWFASSMVGECSEIPEALTPGVEDIASFWKAESRSAWVWFRERFGDGDA